MRCSYGFRGADSTELLRLPQSRDFPLTCSFRFGAEIARAANTVLVAKKCSPQTTKDPAQRTWDPYLVRGGGPPGLVLSASKLPDLELPVTVLGRTNAGIIIAYFLLVKSDEVAEFALIPSLRVALFDHGMVSTFHKLTTGEEIAALLPLRLGESSSVNLPEVRGEVFHSWTAFQETVRVRKIARLTPFVMLVSAYAEHTPAILAVFRAQVLENPVPVEEADVVLCTVHRSKGQEWDNVFVASDVNRLGLHVKRDESGDRKAEFEISAYSDEINLWYVALTRAKKKLYPPPKFFEILASLEAIRLGDIEALNGLSGANAEQPIAVDLEDLQALRRDVVAPWRQAMLLQGANHDWLQPTGEYASLDVEDPNMGAMELSRYTS